ncbi:MAG: lipoyl(octanoyl) transferase LipB [Bacteroidota bacterium]
MTNKNKQTKFKDLGLIDYKQAWDYQEQLFQDVVNHKLNNRKCEKEEELQPTPNYLLFCEHPHVYTLGKNGSENNLLVNQVQLQNHDAQFYKIDRGGDITYHGPGQIVGYPIIDLDNFSPDIHQYVAYLEEAIILTIADYGIRGERLKGASGVWIDADDKTKARKICAIGIKASRWVTMHGFAFNVKTNLQYFDYINPCGFTDKKATSLEKETAVALDMNQVKQKVKTNLSKLFGFEYKEFT